MKLRRLAKFPRSTVRSVPKATVWIAFHVTVRDQRLKPYVRVRTAKCALISAQLVLDLWLVTTWTTLTFPAGNRSCLWDLEAFISEHSADYWQINNIKLLMFSSAQLVIINTWLFSLYLTRSLSLSLPLSVCLLMANSLRTHTFPVFPSLCVVVYNHKETSFVWERAGGNKNKERPLQKQELENPTLQDRWDGFSLVGFSLQQ